MSFLRKTKVKAVPLWLILLITIGTASGVLLWISNQISTSVDVQETPITLVGAFETSPTQDIQTYSTFEYWVNDEAHDIGYIVLEFIAGSDIGPSNFTVDVKYTPWGEIQSDTQPVSGYPMNHGSNAVLYAFEQSGGGAIDFGPSGGYYGTIDINITYHVALAFTVTMQLSSTSS